MAVIFGNNITFDGSSNNNKRNDEIPPNSYYQQQYQGTTDAANNAMGQISGGSYINYDTAENFGKWNTDQGVDIYGGFDPNSEMGKAAAAEAYQTAQSDVNSTWNTAVNEKNMAAAGDVQGIVDWLHSELKNGNMTEADVREVLDWMSGFQIKDPHSYDNELYDVHSMYGDVLAKNIQSDDSTGFSDLYAALGGDPSALNGGLNVDLANNSAAEMADYWLSNPQNTNDLINMFTEAVSGQSEETASAMVDAFGDLLVRSGRYTEDQVSALEEQFMKYYSDNGLGGGNQPESNAEPTYADTAKSFADAVESAKDKYLEEPEAADLKTKDAKNAYKEARFKEDYSDGKATYERTAREYYEANKDVDPNMPEVNWDDPESKMHFLAYICNATDADGNPVFKPNEQLALAYDLSKQYEGLDASDKKDQGKKNQEFYGGISYSMTDKELADVNARVLEMAKNSPDRFMNYALAYAAKMWPDLSEEEQKAKAEKVAKHFQHNVEIVYDDNGGLIDPGFMPFYGFFENATYHSDAMGGTYGNYVSSGSDITKPMKEALDNGSTTGATPTTTSTPTAPPTPPTQEAEPDVEAMQEGLDGLDAEPVEENASAENPELIFEGNALSVEEHMANALDGTSARAAKELDAGAAKAKAAEEKKKQDEADAAEEQKRILEEEERAANEKAEAEKQAEADKKNPDKLAYWEQEENPFEEGTDEHEAFERTRDKGISGGPQNRLNKKKAAFDKALADIAKEREKAKADEEAKAAAEAKAKEEEAKQNDPKNMEYWEREDNPFDENKSPEEYRAYEAGRNYVIFGEDSPAVRQGIFNDELAKEKDRTKRQSNWGNTSTKKLPDDVKSIDVELDPLRKQAYNEAENEYKDVNWEDLVFANDLVEDGEEIYSEATPSKKLDAKAYDMAKDLTIAYYQKNGYGSGVSPSDYAKVFEKFYLRIMAYKNF